MKKILSLVLALLTVVGLSTASFAAPVYTKPQVQPAMTVSEYLKGYANNIYDIGDVIRFFDFYDDGVVYTNDIYTSWIASCPKDDCDETAFFYVEGGKIYWICPFCNSTGVITSDSTPSGHIHPGTKKLCPSCGKDNIKYIETSTYGGKAIDIYYCFDCHELFYLPSYDYTPSGKDFGLKETMKCLTHGCSKTSKLKDIEADGDALYARYECEAGHINRILVTSDYFDYGDGYYARAYNITVVSAAGGTYAIGGTARARYGESKTVTFYPNEGYTLTSVLVNGVSVTPKNNQVSFVVYGDVVVRPTFTKTVVLRDYTITATANGNGSISVVKNNVRLSSAATVTAKNADTVVYGFTPASSNYRISDVKIDGKSKGAISTYTFTNLSANHTVAVTFAWNNPYSDVESKYAAAVEYVTEAGIMGPYMKTNGLTLFSGRVGITVGDLVNALAELSDTAGRLNSNDDRRAWAVNFGIVSKKTELSDKCDVQQACTIIKNYLEVLEDLNKVTFTKLDRNGTVRSNAISLNLATGKTYDANRSLHRYDLAAICRLIARLDYKG